MKANDQINIKGYRWIGFNREMKHIRAPKASGGVGFFIKNTFLNDFDVHIVDKEIDGLLGILLTEKLSEAQILLFTGYLPPENSKWGRNPEIFYGHLLSKIYFYSTVDMVVICGDLNARIGQLKDCIADIDNIPNRVVIDQVKNKHGESFIDFLIESRMCILNGRLNPLSDGYTSVSTKGSAVVDYIAVCHDNFSNCNSFCVESCTEIISKCTLQNLIGEKCKVPDHALLSSVINLSVSLNDVKHVNPIQVNHCPNSTTYVNQKYDFKHINQNFMQSAEVAATLDKIIRGDSKDEGKTRRVRLRV